MAKIPGEARIPHLKQLYLGDTPYHLKKVAEQIDKWPAPEKPKGKPLGLWKIPEEEQVPAWQTWRDRWETIQRRKEEKEEAEGSEGTGSLRFGQHHL